MLNKTSEVGRLEDPLINLHCMIRYEGVKNSIACAYSQRK